MSLHFSRIQFTPDLMPADIVGTQMVVEDEHGRKRFELQRGPIFGQLVLADEINRATPKTQSALLEAMAEQSVTIAGKRHALQAPFFVLATQNPIEMEGTYPLPEAQLDRFLFKVLVPNPDEDTLVAILHRTTGLVSETVPVVLDAPRILEQRELVLWIEDLHWADGSTVDVITQLTRDNSTAVLVTTRPAFRAPWLVDDTTVRIERLPDRDSRRIAELLAPSGTPGHQLARLVERADGVPLFLMALARHRHHAGDDLPASLHEVLLSLIHI